MNSRRLRLVPEMNGELSPTIPEAAGSPLPHERAVLAATLSDIDSIVTSLLEGGSPLAGRQNGITARHRAFEPRCGAARPRFALLSDVPMTGFRANIRQLVPL
jgi:hypothetical protein